MLVVTGWNSRITQELLRMLPASEETMRVEANASIPTQGDRYFFCAGVIRAKATVEQTDAEMAVTFMVNCGGIIRACDKILAHNGEARICIVGSESAFSWSYDGAYAAAKAGLHRYVETKALRTPHQQLICVAPGIIGDAGMTTRRDDTDRLMKRMLDHPKRRFLQSVEVARLVHYCLYVDQGYLSGTVIRLNGGEHTSCKT